ncbi:MAG: orotate phosphoribosyltransferase [Acidimicrobiaceae bacterium]|jgi:orotate phosphoribosyltransferase|nr:orotate phosphoribosyltransferase [Acidimicrobiaceae bacterium]
MSTDRADLARRVYQCAHITGTFTLRSGAVSNEYFDKYLFEADPHLLRDLAEALAGLVPAGVDALAGLELGGVPIATMLSQVTGVPARFVRKQAKTYGTAKLAEGGELAGLRLCVVEDVVTSGGQVVESCQALRDEGAEIARVLCVIDREAGGADNLAADKLDLHALFTMTELKAAAGA